MCCLGGFFHCRGLSQSPRSYSSGLQSFSLSEAHTQCLVPRGSAPKKGDIRFEMLSKREKIGLSNRKQTSRGPLAPAEGFVVSSAERAGPLGFLRAHTSQAISLSLHPNVHQAPWHRTPKQLRIPRPPLRHTVEDVLREGY